MTNPVDTSDALNKLLIEIRSESERLGFQALGVTSTDLGEHIQHYQDWIDKGHHGALDYMHSHGSKRWKPDELIDGTLRVISVRMNYLPESAGHALEQLEDKSRAYISRYTLGRDYHKLIRNRLKHLIHFVRTKSELDLNFRAFVDSAPVLERAIAQRSGLGWFGKNTMIIHREAGSWFFLGEIYTNLALPITPSYEKEHCGRCTACLDICPTKAFTAPYELDARRCISYLTIENKSEIPLEFRKDMGNRIFGCDDCQLVCPWNKFAQHSDQDDFTPRHELDKATLVSLFGWTESEFLAKTEGSAIRRTGYHGWLRNIAVALGNAPTSIEVIEALKAHKNHEDGMVREHVAWALAQHID
ncbi:epoxyqueuosine reductase [Oleiphilus sp. HI0009]|uniref:tRNA epoxyqueuosine(34) reductase QueG n=2 Tax=Oleiphilus TaxID=141450 RepID=UPI0007C3F282|nr:MULTISPECIES: tRNA epoxyqueuosine(34) reductase QueG [unclassified Oleiphilus]KZX75569.1 epoxyqueuosine reductase [Oleiphilus sp. HI0009]KZY68842.1 epoxyqueuosine reductase [Oleiphilus sp. HI0067]KZY69427.1 epoxyqueuosine reductase [Oleiphilus sp. HI0066]